MPEVTATRLTDMCSQNDVDPFAVVSLLSLQALADADAAKLAFWRSVADRLRNLGVRFN